MRVLNLTKSPQLLGGDDAHETPPQVIHELRLVDRTDIRRGANQGREHLPHQRKSPTTTRRLTAALRLKRHEVAVRIADRKRDTIKECTNLTKNVQCLVLGAEQAGERRGRRPDEGPHSRCGGIRKLHDDSTVKGNQFAPRVFIRKALHTQILNPSSDPTSEGAGAARVCVRRACVSSRLHLAPDEPGARRIRKNSSTTQSMDS